MSKPNTGAKRRHEPAGNSPLNFLLGAIVLLVGLTAAYELVTSVDLTAFFVTFGICVVAHIPYVVKALTERA